MQANACWTESPKTAWAGRREPPIILYSDSDYCGFSGGFMYFQWTVPDRNILMDAGLA